MNSRHAVPFSLSHKWHGEEPERRAEYFAGNLMTRRIRKAVFPVAGLGTRFLPATKSIPKEMLTVVDRPVLQHVVDEAREAGIEHFIFVTGRNKAVIEDHFDIAYELEEPCKARQAQGMAGSKGGSPGGRRDEFHPPAGAARPRPCGLVRRATLLAMSPSRFCCPTGDDGGGAGPLSCAMCRRL